MNERIRKMTEAAVAGDVYSPSVPYETELPKTCTGIGQVIYNYLALQPLELREDEYLADRYRVHSVRPWGFPFCYYRNFSKSRGQYWSSLCHSHPTKLFYWGWTHVALDFEYLLTHGLEAYYHRIEASKAAHAGDPEAQDFLEGMKLCLDAICERYDRYAAYCAELAEQKPEQRDILLRLADSLTRVPRKPAESFFDAVQCTWIGFLIAPDSLARIDQYLLPYYRRDLESGAITQDFAFELLEELFVKVHETQAYGEDISGHNHLVVGGYLQDGTDGFNELSRLVLEAIADLPTHRPQASFRYTRHTTPETLRYITEMNHRSQLIVFVNDEPRINGMVACGIDRQDAIEYSVIGCNEWAIPGKSLLDLAHINLVNSLERVIYEYPAPNSYEEFYRSYEASLKQDFQAIIEEFANYTAAKLGDRNVFTSIFHDDCIENARPMSDRGTKYYGLTMSFNGVSNVADSLSVIKQFVFDEKRCTYGELLTALKANWVGYEELRREILKDGHFFGNDDAYADTIAQALIHSLYRTKEQMSSPHIKNLIIGSFVGASHPNIKLGKLTRATPDGRFDGEGFTMGISQTIGKDKTGITALLKSIAKLDYAELCGCVVSNLKMDKALANTPEKRDRLANLYHTFLKLGGMQLQINYLSNEELLAAQRNPEEYSNLMVRVTGYSGYFTRFDTDLQNDIIARTSQG